MEGRNGRILACSQQVEVAISGYSVFRTANQELDCLQPLSDLAEANMRVLLLLLFLLLLGSVFTQKFKTYMDTFVGKRDYREGALATQVEMIEPVGIAIDQERNELYVAAGNSVKIFHIPSSTWIATYGTSNEGFFGDREGFANLAQLQPKSVAIDSANNLVYIADTGSHRIRVVNRLTNVVSTFAGTDIYDYSGDEEIDARNISLRFPNGVAIDCINSLVYIADTGSDRIRVVNRLTNVISTFAGTGSYGYSGDGNDARNASLAQPSGVSVDTVNNLVYIVDRRNHRIRVVNRSTNIISTFAGTGSIGYSGDGNDARNASLANPSGIAIDSFNNLVYIADTGNKLIRVVNRSTNVISAFAGTGRYEYSELGIDSLLRNPKGVAVDSTRNLVYIADSANNRIRVVNRLTNAISTFAGTGTQTYSSDGDARNMSLSAPQEVAIDSSNNIVYIAETGRNRVRVVNGLTGVISTFVSDVSTTMLNLPKGVTIDSVNNLLYITDTGNNRILVVNRLTNVISTFAGTGSYGYSGDGNDARNALLANPSGIAIDSFNNLVYIADTNNNRIRVVNRLTNVISTFAGTGTGSYFGDGNDARNASLYFPQGVAYDSVNNLVYIADSQNNRVRVVHCSSHVISTFAGKGIYEDEDGIDARNASLLEPLGVAVDSAKNLVYC